MPGKRSLRSRRKLNAAGSTSVLIVTFEYGVSATPSVTRSWIVRGDTPMTLPSRR